MLHSTAEKKRPVWGNWVIQRANDTEKLRRREKPVFSSVGINQPGLLCKLQPQTHQLIPDGLSSEQFSLK